MEKETKDRTDKRMDYSKIKAALVVVLIIFSIIGADIEIHILGTYYLAFTISSFLLCSILFVPIFGLYCQLISFFKNK